MDGCCLLSFWVPGGGVCCWYQGGKWRGILLSMWQKKQIQIDVKESLKLETTC